MTTVELRTRLLARAGVGGPCRRDRCRPDPPGHHPRRRHPRHRLTAELGAGPKTALRLVRFHLTRTALAARVAAGAPADLAGLAAEHGYADQAHLSREFAELAGLPPARWLAAEHDQVCAPIRPIRPPVPRGSLGS